VKNLPQPKWLTEAKPDPNVCRCHHRKHEGRCMVGAGGPMHCLCTEFKPEDLVFGAFTAIARNVMNYKRKA
jgi:hypothetical protein